MRYLEFLLHHQNILGTCALLISISSVRAQSPTLLGCPMFPANSVFNTPINTLPVHPDSATYVQSIGASSPSHAEFGSASVNGMPYVVVPADQPKVYVAFRYGGDTGPYPIPSNVPIEGGSSSTGDRHAQIVDGTNCILYELFSLYPQSNASWTAGSGGIWSLVSNQLRPVGEPGADAAGLPILPLLVRYDEVASGHINHALRFTAPVTQQNYIWPARDWASTTNNLANPPMGLRIRLKQNFDISSYGPHVQVILQALKTYGAFLADNGAAWFIQGVPDARWSDDELHELTQLVGSDFEAVDESSLMVNSNSAAVSTSGPSIIGPWMPGSSKGATTPETEVSPKIEGLGLKPQKNAAATAQSDHLRPGN